MDRRQFLKSAGVIMAGSVLMCTGTYSYAKSIEPQWLVVDKVTVPIDKLAPTFEGFKIVQLSDIHLHPFVTIDFVKEAIAMVNALQPDLVVLTGDYVLAGAESIFELAPALAGLNAKYGVFTILGNHDLWTNDTTIIHGFETERVPVLRNSGLSIQVGKETLYLAGIDDVWSGQPDLQTALDGHRNQNLSILLAHEPDIADSTAQDGRVDLQLSGHTHGGQVRVPGLGALILPPFGQKYDQGLNKVNGMWVYTNRGIGVINPPIRVNCPPEITELTLIRG